MKNQVKRIFYSFTVNRQQSLDSRLNLSSLSNLATELPLGVRYQGMIFWVVDVADFYCFEADLNTPINFRDSVVLSNTQGMSFVDTETGYASLLTNLNSIASPPLGQIVCVFPLGVAFKWDGAAWSYAFGVFEVPDTSSFGDIDTSLLSPGARVLIDGATYIVDSTLALTTEVITVAPSGTPEDNRYYLLSGVLYIGLAGSLYKLGSKSFVQTGQELIVGNTQITHNLNSPYVRGIIWVQSINQLCQLDLQYVDANNSKIDSRVDVTGTLVILADN